VGVGVGQEAGKNVRTRAQSMAPVCAVHHKDEPVCVVEVVAPACVQREVNQAARRSSA
jgi:hypothetical protein